MPRAKVSAFQRDAKGRFSTWNGIGSEGVLYRRTADDDRLRPRPPNHFADYAQLLTANRYIELVSESRAQSAKGLLSALIDNKAGYVSASHWRPRFTGADSDYGTKAYAELESALEMCSFRGRRFTWRALWRLSTRCFADSGGFFVLLTTWPDTDQPALQFLESHRIGQRTCGIQEVGANDASTTIINEDGSETVIRGAYAGLTIDNGVITNGIGTEVAYRVLGATPNEDVDISARDLIYVAPPKAYSECRPAPDIAPSLLDFLALELAQTCQLDQQIADARLTFIETNAEGKPSAAQTRLGNAKSTPNGTPVEVYERGGSRFIKTGNTLTGHQTARPSDQWMNFDKRVASRAAVALHWRAEMLDPSELRGAATRAFQDQINTCILDDFNATAPAAVRCLRYFVAKLTKMGRLPKHPEWMQWGIASPPWFEVDRASARIDLEEVAAGRISMAELHHRDGRTTSEVMHSNAYVYQTALAIQKRYPDVPFEIILGDLGKTSSRSGGMQAQGDKKDGEEADRQDDPLAGIEEAKSRADAFGVSVRAGAVTPSEEDEQFMREQLGLPPMSAAVKSAWAKEGVRRPITIAGSQENAVPATPQPIEE